jgi:hypothetical protein
MVQRKGDAGLKLSSTNIAARFLKPEKIKISLSAVAKNAHMSVSFLQAVLNAARACSDVMSGAEDRTTPCAQELHWRSSGAKACPFRMHT